MITKDRIYRNFEVRVQDEGMIVEGYAATFDQPAVMYEYEKIEYKEVIARGAFDGTQMNDVVMNFDHQGKPIARTKNNTLTLTIDDVGLRARADLSGTEAGRTIYEEIKAGYIDKMSFAFTVADESYDKATHTRSINKVKRLYDVAAVSIPAYDTTSIFEAEAEKEKAEARAALELARAKYFYQEVSK